VSRRRALLAGLGLLAVLLLAGAGAVLRGHVDLAVPIASYVTARLGRPVAIAGLRATLGRSLVLDLLDARLANGPGGSRPDMITLRHVQAALDPWALLHFTLVLRRLDIDGLSVLLERDAYGVGHWKFAAAAQQRATTTPPERGTLPTMLDAVLRDSDVTLRTSSGNLLRIGLKQVLLHSDGDDQPVTLSAAGSYNDAPVALKGTTQSFAVLHDTAKPFGADLHMASGASTLDFKGTVMDPLNFDGVKGAIGANAPVLGDLLSVIGVKLRADLPLSLSAALDRNDDDWHFDAAKGILAASAFDGKLELIEGKWQQPDTVKTDLRFQAIDMKALLARVGAADSADAMPQVEAQPGTLLDARLGAAALRYGAVEISDLTTHFAVIAGKVSLDDSAFGIVGGKATLSAEAEPAPSGTHATGAIALTGADIAALGRMLSLGPTQLSGRIDLRAAAEATGTTMQGAMQASRVDGVLAMQDGAIPREIIQVVSSDIGRLFGAKAGVVRVSCLLVGMHLRNLTGPLAPLRLATSDGTITGAGRIDLGRNTIDVFIGTKRASTEFSALDVPFHISGPIASPSVSPVLSASVRDRLRAADDLSDLPNDLRQFARGNHCLREK
jgi:uncharacterized protein involved in outer membrane biogenesis